MIKIKKTFFIILLINSYLSEIKTDHEQYLSPEGAEEQYVETLQNHEDDSNIYNFGLLGQEHTDLVQKMIINLTQFPNCLELANLINKILNQNYFADFEIEENEEDDDLNFDNDMKIKKKIYFIGKKIYSKIYKYIPEVKKEIDQFYEQIDYVEISTEDILEFFDFTEYYESIIKSIDPENPGFFKYKRELDLIVFEFSTSIKDFLQAIYNFTNFHVFFTSFFSPHKDEFLGEDPVNVIFKVDKGVKIVNQILTAKSFIDMFITNILKGISQARSIRNDLLYAINKFKDIKEWEFELGKKRILLENGFYGFWMKICFLSFVVFF